MGEGEKAHGSGGGGGSTGAAGGGEDSLQEGVQVGLWGPWGAKWGPWMIPDGTCHVGRTGGVRCPHALPIHWQLCRRGCGGWCGAPGFPCGP